MIEPPDFDPDLLGHSAIVREEICHAVVSDVVDGEYRSDVTECGIVLVHGSMLESETRKSVVERGINMCPDCWPAHVVSEDRSH